MFMQSNDTLGLTTEIQIQKIRQILTDEDLEATYVSGKLWQVVSDAFQAVVTTTKDFNLYTFSPDGAICSRVWPAKENDNLATEDVFGEQFSADEQVEIRGEEVFVHIFGGPHRRLMTARFEATINDDERKSLEWLSPEIGAALMERRQKRAVSESKQLRDRLQSVDDQDRPQVLLDFFVKLLLRNDLDGLRECGGELRVVCESSEVLPEPHLKLVAHTDGVHTEQPLRISSATKLVRQVLETKVPVVVVGRSKKFTDIEKHMMSCVKLPVTSWDGRVLGVLCVHLNRVCCFNLGMIHVAELLIERCAAVEIERARQPDEMTRRADRLRKMIPTASKLSEDVRDKKWADARHFLYQDLSQRALNMSGAFRTAVALVGPDLTTGVGVGGTAGDWGDDFDGKIIRFDDDNSGVIEALRSGMPYLVEDVDDKKMRFLKIGDRPIGSAANIPISAGFNRLGVLDVEWAQKAGYDPLLVRYLTELCNVYGFVLNSVGIERHFVELEEKLKVAERDRESEVDYRGIMRLVAEMFGVREGDILIRDPNMGRYFFRANLLKEHLIEDPQAYFEPDQGLTGAIISAGKTERRLRIGHDLGSDFSQGSGVSENRLRKNVLCNDYLDVHSKTSFLGAPIASANEVFGVIRLNSDASIREFDSIDERNLTAVALRIAECLAQRIEFQRSRSRLATAQQFLRNQEWGRIVQPIFDNIAKGVGTCQAHIRLLDEQRESPGPCRQVLARTAVSDPTFIRPKLFHTKDSTLAGRVWETGEPFDDPDVRHADSPCQLLCTQEFCTKVGAVYVVPLKTLGKDFVGTLHVYKEYRHGFNEAEKAFLRELSKIIAAGLLSVAERHKANVLHKMVATQENMLRLFMAGEEYLAAQQRLLLDVMDVLVNELDCQEGWLAIPTNNGYELCYSKDRRKLDLDPIDLELSSLLAEKAFSGVGRAVAPRFFQQLPFTIDDETQFMLLPVRVQERALAYFVLLHQGERVTRNESIMAVLGVLDHLGDFLQLAQQVKDAQIGLPLMLLGTRASVLQHKSRDPFSILKGLCERLVHEPGLEQSEREEIDEMVGKHVARLDEILKIMQELVQMATADPNPLNVVDTLTPILDKLKSQDNLMIEIWLNDCVHDDLVVRAREGYLRTAFEFVLNNARDAIGKNPGGEILVKLTRKADQIFIEIIDNGCGMERDVLCRALDPGFTTKDGTGLGLPSAYSIIASHGGRLTLSSNPGTGTTCQISLPRMETILS
jgi:signal transduction histidine kinase/transcriptional regulator with GAF, ATPase, and Fis domain